MPGPHDFAVRSDLIVTPSTGMCAADQKSGEGVKAPFVLRAGDRSRENPPAISSRGDAAASTASHPT
jgi:hypothetical protein